jgi:hypothetical protein
MPPVWAQCLGALLGTHRAFLARSVQKTEGKPAKATVFLTVASRRTSFIAHCPPRAAGVLATSLTRVPIRVSQGATTSPVDPRGTTHPVHAMKNDDHRPLRRPVLGRVPLDLVFSMCPRRKSTIPAQSCPASQDGARSGSVRRGHIEYLTTTKTSTSGLRTITGPGPGSSGGMSTANSPSAARWSELSLQAAGLPNG